MEQKLSAIVVLSNDDVSSVFVVPTEEATFDSIESLRQQVRASGVRDIRIQRVAYDSSKSSNMLSSMEQATKFLEEFLADKGSF